MINLKFEPAVGHGAKILALGAHCDDIEIGCGGTLLKWIDQHPNTEVKWVVFASNEIRKKEALKSAQRFLDGLNSAEIDVLNYRDAFLPTSFSHIKEYFETLKTSFNPDVIFTHYRQDRHQDHRLISDLTWNTFRDHFILEYEIPKYDGDLGIPNCFCQLEEQYVQKKINILLDCFESQKNKHWFEPETFKSLMRLRGLESASSQKYAEAFHARKWLICP